MLNLSPTLKFWLAASALGIFGSTISLAVFNLIYRDYPVPLEFGPLLAAVLIAALTLALLNTQQSWLDRRLPWQTGIAHYKDPVR
jgi:uncharacterized membrane protein YraQ (UPF0718 family)